MTTSAWPPLPANRPRSSCKAALAAFGPEGQPFADIDGRYLVIQSNDQQSVHFRSQP